MKEDREGFLQPLVDTNRCIGCHKCERICPILNPEEKKYYETKAFAAINLDENIRFKSSSGGVFYAIAKWIIEQKGIVFGARFNEEWQVIHDYTETLEGIAPFMGSKYVQSFIGDSYVLAKKFLDDGRWVLFSGTPCQLRGLRSFLGIEYERLLQVDIICHGVPSPGVWRRYLNEISNKTTITNISFRDKGDGWKDYSVQIIMNDRILRERFKNNIYMQGFLKDVFLRNSCYDCKFRDLHRNTDLTLADYWGVDIQCPSMFDDKGTSLVFTHSKKGLQILSEIEPVLRIVEQSPKIALEHNPMMCKSNPHKEKRSCFFYWFGLGSFSRSFSLIDRNPFIVRVIRRIKRVVNRINA